MESVKSRRAAADVAPGLKVGLTRREREALRLQSADMFGTGLSHSEIARRLGVSRKSVIDWHKQFEEAGIEGLRYKPCVPSRLSESQCEEVRAALLLGPDAHGFPTQLWTLERAAELIERTTGVRYSSGHVWRVMRERLGFTCQKPMCRAKERDEEAIARWVAETWPAIKRGPGNRKLG